MAGRIILDVANPALNSNGAVDSGATLTFYQNLTTTPQSVYADQGLLTPLANPLSCDAAGRFPVVWASSSNNYSVKWSQTGASPTTFDNIVPIGPTSGTLSGPIGIGMAPGVGALFEGTATLNGEIYSRIFNPNSGVSANTKWYASNGTHSCAFGQLGENFTTSGALIAGYGFVSATTGLSLIAAGGPVILSGTTGVMVGTTTPGGGIGNASFASERSATGQAIESYFSGSSGSCVFARVDNIAAKFATFAYNSFIGSPVGSITTDGTITAYNTTSDYRAKDIEGPLVNSGPFIDAFQPKIGKWKRNGAPFVGFLAHEVQAFSPSSVHGEKDGKDETGEPAYQAMDYSAPEIMTNIIAELQALRRRVFELESK